MRINDEINVQNDEAESLGQVAHIACPGERVVIYGPTWIVMGTVRRTGPLAFELEDAGIVYEAGNHQTRERGSEDWEGLDWERWPESLIRIPSMGVIVVALDRG